MIKKSKNDNGEQLTYLNVGTGFDISIKKLAELISNEYGYFGKIKWDQNKPDGTPKKLLDITRIKEMGWEPKISLGLVLEEQFLNLNKFITLKISKDKFIN